MPFVLVADLKVKEKHLAEFTRRIRRHANNSVTREPGCVSFEVSVDRDDPCRFVLYEVYVSEEDFEKHKAMPFMQKHMSETASMMDGEVKLLGFYERLTAPAK